MAEQFFDNDAGGISYGYPRVHFSREERHGPVHSGTIFLKNGKPTPLDEFNPAMNLLSQRPVRGADGKTHSPEDGVSWLNALQHHFTGSYYHASPVINSPDEESGIDFSHNHAFGLSDPPRGPGDEHWRENYSGLGRFKVPPVKMHVSKDGKLSILDGNHRIQLWEESNHTHVPAYVVDERGKGIQHEIDTDDFDKDIATGEPKDDYPEWPPVGMPTGIEPSEGEEPDVDASETAAEHPSTSIDQAHALVSEDNGISKKPQTPDPKGFTHTLDSDGISSKPVLDQAEEASTADKAESLKAQKAATKSVFKNMPIRARQTLKANVDNVVYNHDGEDATAEYDPVSRSITVNSLTGHSDIDKDLQSAVFARATANGVDETPEWKQAWEKDIKGKLTLEADKSPKSGWDEFVGRFAHSAGVSAEESSKLYPAATAYTQGLGLIPESNKKPLVQLVEALTSPPPENGYTAYSPQKAGLMTYARIGMRSAGEALQGLGEKLAEIKSTVPKPLVQAVEGAMKFAFFSHLLANKAVNAFEQQRGTNDKTREVLSKALVGADLVLGGKVFPAAVQLATQDWRLALASSFIPVGSLAYLAVAGGRDLLSWKKVSKAAHQAAKNNKEKDFAAQPSPEEMMDAIAFHVEKIPPEDHDKWLMAFYAGMDAAHGDVEEACDIADEVYNEAQTDESKAGGTEEEITEDQIDNAPELQGEANDDEDDIPELHPD